MKVLKLLQYTIAAATIAIILIPIIWILLNSFKFFKDIVSMNVFSGEWTCDNYHLIFFSRDENINVQIWNSIVYVAMTLLITMPMAIFAGYGLARLPRASMFKWGILNFLVFSRVLPAMSIALPYLVLYRSLGIYNTAIGLGFVYVLKTLPLAIFMIMTFIEEVPMEIEEAALIDGASLSSLLGKVIIPLISPGAVATAIFVFIYTWNDYLFAVFLAGKEAANLQVAVAGFNAEYFIRWGEMSAATMLSIVPVIVFTILTQKYLIRGLTLGALKQ